MKIPRNWSVLLLSLALATPLWAQTTPEAAKEQLGKIAHATSQWMFQRPWQMQASCAEVQALVETALDLHMRQAMAAMPVTPPQVKIDHFLLVRQPNGVQVRAKLAGLPPQMEQAAEAEANKLLATAPQGQVLRALLLQPLAITTFGNGQVLKDAECRVAEETEATLTIVLTPAEVARVMGREAKEFVVRIDKARNVVAIIRANFADESMLQARFAYGEVKAKDQESFSVPTAVELTQKGMDAPGQPIAFPATSTIKYDKCQIGAVPAQ